MQSRPSKSGMSSRPEGGGANVTAAVGMGETYGRMRARRTSLYTKTVLWITGLVCTAFLLGTLAQAWSNSILMEKVQQGQQTLNEAQSKHTALQKAADHYQDPNVIESEARQQLGFIRPGEQPVVIIDGNNQGQQPIKPESDTAPQTNFWQDWWHVFFSLGDHK